MDVVNAFKRRIKATMWLRSGYVQAVHSGLMRVCVLHPRLQTKLGAGSQVSEAGNESVSLCVYCGS